MKFKLNLNNLIDFNRNIFKIEMLMVMLLSTTLTTLGVLPQKYLSGVLISQALASEVIPHNEEREKITRLNFSAMNLTEIPESVYTDFPNLEWLDLSDNKITSVDSRITSLTKLKFLDLRNNQIIDFPIREFKRYLNLVEKKNGFSFSIEGNPVHSPKSIEEIIQCNNFCIERGLSEYLNLIPELDNVLIQVANNRDIANIHIIDGGAGDLFFENDILSAGAIGPVTGDNIDASRAFSLSNKLLLTAITYKIEGTANYERICNSSRVRIFKDKFFEEIEDQLIIKDFGKADIIVDLYGILAYSKYPDVVLAKYFNLLKDNGTIFIYNPSIGSSHIALSREGISGVISLDKWMKQQITGIEVSVLRNSSSEEYFVIKIIDKEKIKMPKLKFEYFSCRRPPIRFFREEID
ncbi:MAG: leucine-rich repeat domain-containing protein [Oligoflexia bacterium]|nr:leucine-rich repeat domain-containing protein [Oligoflexia bacterium]